MDSKNKKIKSKRLPDEENIIQPDENVGHNPGTTLIKSLATFKIQAIVLILIGLIVNSTTFFNEYALDDGIVILKNEYVQEGFRGIPKIMSTDAYDSFYKQMNARHQLSGGRYRPLSVVTFAIEQQLFGTKKYNKITENNDTPLGADKTLATIRHVLNVLFYILSVVLLLYLLRHYVFTTASPVAFVASLIFLIHPIHTEVVANVKSRDEILSFLFIVLTLIMVQKYRQVLQKKYILYGLLCYLFALLSKEYAITLVALIPVMEYTVNKVSLKDSIKAALPYLAVAVLYVFVRYSIVGKGGHISDPDVLNDPFKYATNSEKWATKIELLDHYIKLLFYPHPLSCDYSYNTIPYTTFGNGWVWIAILVHLGLFIEMIILFFKRNVLAFALAFYLINLLLVSNLLMDIGATMGERLIYHSSLGFAMALAIVLFWVLGKIASEKVRVIVGLSLCLIITISCGTLDIKRNTEWKNDASLFIADASTVPNSALANGNAGKAYIDLSEQPENKDQEPELIKKAIYHLERSVSIHKEYVNGYLNLGVAYFKQKDYDKALENWEIAKRIYPNNPFLKRNLLLMGTVYYNEAMKMGRQHPKEAQQYLERAVTLDAGNVEYWYNLGGVSYTMGDYKRAKEAWDQTLQLKPDHQEAKRGMAALPAGLVIGGVKQQ